MVRVVVAESGRVQRMVISWRANDCRQRGSFVRNGQLLEAGRTYDGARRYPFNDAAPGLSISGDGRGCNELSGTFTVNKIEFDAAGTLRAFEVTFEQHCEHFTPALRGTWTFAAA
jgi:hypothetical protein